MIRPVLVHTERKRPPKRSYGDDRLVHAVSEHVAKHIGPIGWVLHELVSDLVHVDMLWVQPGPGRDFHTFVTCGMSERPMVPPPGWNGLRHAELLLRLPRSWKLGHQDLDDHRNKWPITELALLARMPHLYEAWLWEYHTVANGDPPEPLPGADRFSGSMLWPVEWTEDGFETLAVDLGRAVRFFSVLPLYAEELTLAHRVGLEELVDRIDEAGVTDLVDVDRPNVAERRSLQTF
jgi:hypothetical protein